MYNRIIKRKVRRFWAQNLLAAWVLPFLPRFGENAPALTVHLSNDTLWLLLIIQTILVGIALLRIQWHLRGYISGVRTGRRWKPPVQFVLPETEYFGRHLPAMLFGNVAAMILVCVAAEFRAPEWIALCIPGTCGIVAAICAVCGGRKNGTPD